jgi:hypothetical protein
MKTSNNNFNEDVVANAVGGGNIAGLGIGSQGEPGMLRRKKFAGNEVFTIDAEKFNKCRMGKYRYHKYESYVGNDEVGNQIREYGIKNPGKAIVVEDEKTGAMMFLRYGKR